MKLNKLKKIKELCNILEKKIQPDDIKITENSTEIYVVISFNTEAQ